MFSPKTKRTLLRVLPFGIIWLITGCVFLFIEHAAVINPDSQSPFLITPNTEVLFFALPAVFLLGCIVGFIEVLYLDAAVAHLKFVNRILLKLLIYLVLLYLVITITFPLAKSLEIGKSYWDPEVINSYRLFLPSKVFISTVVQMLFSLGISFFYEEMSSYIGHRALSNFFTGKYHHPVEEERIFMFLDMKSSTTIAEQLGHHKYFKLLKSYYTDISEPIIHYQGDLYQYVGDEVIVSWQFEDSEANNRCLDCFFAMKIALEKQAEIYLSTYGVSPTFKAGIHYGKVTTGEIGEIKKDIFYTGDVLNSTARIQGLCNNFGVDILISEELINHLELENKYQSSHMGKTILRGRKGEMDVYTIEKITS